jgi:signal peptidase I
MTTGKQRGVLFHLVDVLFNIIVIVAIVAGIRTFLVSPFQVEGGSMTSTLENNEYIIINKLSYYLGEPNRGDIVVFRPESDPQKYYVKRVIGLPGDEVTIRDGYVYLKKAGDDTEVKLEEPYLDDRNAGKTYRHPPLSGDTSPERFTVPTDHYFVMGDNRQGSLDSRSFMGAGSSPLPYVPQENIKGKVWFIALPISKIHAFEAPEYNL